MGKTGWWFIESVGLNNGVDEDLGHSEQKEVKPSPMPMSQC